MQPDILCSGKVIITAAITGGLHGKFANENIPITPEEQAQDALDCYNAGASVLHLHVRGEDGQNTPDINIYTTAVTLNGEKCPLIRQIGNGIGAYLEKDWKVVNATLQQRLNLLTIRPQAEMHTINAGSFEFRTPYGSATFENPMDFNEKYVKGCKEQGIGLEIEVYDLGHIENIKELLAKGVLTPPLHFSIVLGIKGGAPASAKNLLHMIEELPEGATWQVVTIGKYHVRTTLMAMCLGGNARTGLEDTIYFDKGEKAKSNAQLVERLVGLAREIGREPATVEEARQMLGLNGAHGAGES